MKWAVGDVHGCFSELAKLLSEIDFQPERDHIVFLGDLIDRGEQSRAVVDFVRSGQSEGHFSVLRGNHEDDWLRAVKAGVDEWYRDRHQETWQSFGGRRGIRELAEWVETLPVYIETDSAVLIHGGMLPDRHFAEQAERDLLWARNTEFIRPEYRNDKIVLHGHTPVDYPLILPDRINIDTGCVFGGRLTALSLDALARGEILWQSVDGWRKCDVS